VFFKKVIKVFQINSYLIKTLTNLQGFNRLKFRLTVCNYYFCRKKEIYYIYIYIYILYFLFLSYCQTKLMNVFKFITVKSYIFEYGYSKKIYKFFKKK